MVVTFTFNKRPQTYKITFPRSFSFSIRPGTKKVSGTHFNLFQLQTPYEEKCEQSAPTKPMEIALKTTHEKWNEPRRNVGAFAYTKFA